MKLQVPFVQLPLRFDADRLADEMHALGESAWRPHPQKFPGNFALPLISVEGDPDSPISRGHLCPKGANTFELHTHPDRLTKVRYRAPYSSEWQDLDLEEAMDMVADRVWESRERTFVEKKDGQVVAHTKAICHLGGATLDNEENYLIKKLFSGGLGMVCISNQARI